jgi:hypothetical protein
VLKALHNPSLRRSRLSPTLKGTKIRQRSDHGIFVLDHGEGERGSEDSKINLRK